MTTTETLLNKVKENLELIQKEFNQKEDYSKTSHSEKINLWENYGKARLYVPRNAFEQAGYIDLMTGELNASRPGNHSSLQEVLDFINNLK